MQKTFSVSVPAETRTLHPKKDGRADVTYTVTNNKPHPARARVPIVAKDGANHDWFEISGNAERDFGAEESQQYKVLVAVPAATPAGTYGFRIDAVNVANPQEDFTEGDIVSIDWSPPKPKPKAKMKLPRWLWPTVAALALVIAIGCAVYLIPWGGGAELDLTYVTDDFVAAVILHPNRMLESSFGSRWPIDTLKSIMHVRDEDMIMRELTQKDNLDQIIVLLPKPIDERWEDRFAVIFRFVNEASAHRFEDVLQKDGFVESDLAGKAYYSTGGGDGFCFVDERTCIFGESESIVVRMIDDDEPSGKLVNLLRAVDADHDMIAVADLTFLRKPPEEFDRQLKRGMGHDDVPHAAKKVFELRNKLKSAIVTADIDLDPLVSLVVETEDEATASQLRTEGDRLLAVPRGLLNTYSGQIRNELPESSADKILELLDQLVQARISSEGFNVQVSINRPEAWQELPDLIKPAIEEQQKKAKVAATHNRLRNIAMAMQIYDVEYGHFPRATDWGNAAKGAEEPEEIADGEASAVAVATAEAETSWRVQILPYIDRGDLYDDYRRDEPWDSEHNRRLLKQMPDIYGDDPDGKTSIMVFAGANSMFPESELVSFPDIRDGSANTLLVVEAGVDKAIPWTKPEDLEFDGESDPWRALGKMPDGGFFAVMADSGTVRLTERIKTPGMLKALITRNGSEDIDHQALGDQ